MKKLQAAKTSLTFLLAFSFFSTRAQPSEGLYPHLYTDSLKRGNFNYISIDGKMADGRFTPLDTSDLEFSSSGGVFYGNSLFLPLDFTDTIVNIQITLRRNKAIQKQLTMPVKRTEDNGTLDSGEELNINSGKRRSYRKKSG